MRTVLLAVAIGAAALLVCVSAPRATPAKKKAAATSQPAAATSQPAAATSQPAKEKIKAVIVFESHVGRVELTHKDHVDEHGADCNSCHHAVRAKPIKTPHDAYFATSRVACNACHEEGKGAGATQACRACHYDYHKAKGCDDETLSPMLATHKKCWECHDRGEGVKATKACKTCHKGPAKPW